MGHVPEKERVIARLGDTSQGRVFSLLFNAGPDGMSLIDLSIAIFGNRLGTSEKSFNDMRSTVSRLRQSIKPFGYFIPRNKRLERGVYRLIPMESET